MGITVFFFAALVVFSALGFFVGYVVGHDSAKHDDYKDAYELFRRKSEQSSD